MDKGQSTGNGNSFANGPGGPPPLPGLGGVGVDLYGQPANPLWNGHCGPR